MSLIYIFSWAQELILFDIVPQMAHVERAEGNDLLAARIAELEAQLVQVNNEHQQQLENLQNHVLELEDQNGQLEAQKRELELELNEVKENAEFADEGRIEAEEQLAHAQQTIQQQATTIAQLQEQVNAANNELAQAQNVIQNLHADLDDAQDDFVNLIQMHIAHHNPQPPVDEEEVSGLDYETPPTLINEDVMSDADSTASHA